MSDPCGATSEDWGLWDLGLGLTTELLPVVCEPWLPVAPTSVLKDYGKVPSRFTREGLVVGFPAWTTHVTTGAEIEAWSADSRLGICLQTRTVHALDVDVESPGTVQHILNLLSFYDLPIRYRANSPRALLLFRPETPTGKRVLTCASGIIELLGLGSQCVIAGQHPSGARYQWRPFDRIPTLEDAEVAAILETLAESLGTTPWTVPKSTRTRTQTATVVPDACTEFLEMHADLRGISPTGGYYLHCPFVDDHGKQQADKSQTLYYQAGTGGFALAHIKCLDSACAGYTDHDFLTALGWTDHYMTSGFVDETETPVIHALIRGVDGPDPEAPSPLEMPVHERTGDIAHGRGAILPLTELGTADRLAQILGRYAAFVPDRDEWLIWAGRWLVDTGSAMLYARMRALAPRLYEEAKPLLCVDQPSAAKLFKWALAIQSKGAMEAILTLTGRIPSLRRALPLLDAHPLLLGLDGGRSVLNLDDGSIRPSQPDDWVTKSLGVQTVSRSETPHRWVRFLDELFPGDTELQAWLQRWCGYLLTAETREHCLLFLYGSGRNGKTVFINTLTSILGNYATVVKSSVLTQSAYAASAGSATPDIARLAGARLVSASETEDGSTFAESLVKSLTGGDRISARFLHCNPFEFTPMFKLMIAGNHKPILKGTDVGIWRRMHLVPFTRVFSEAEADQSLAGVLQEEAPAILGWMLAGYQLWKERGLGKTPATVKAATDEYRESMDTLGEFLIETLAEDVMESVAAVDLFRSYTEWCEKCGLRQPTRQAFGRKIQEYQGMSIHRHRVDSGFMYQGVRFKVKPGWL